MGGRARGPLGTSLFLLQRVLDVRGAGSARIVKVKGHATDVMVRDGLVRSPDKYSNVQAHDAAEFGRRRYVDVVIPVRSVCARRH